MDEWVGSGWTIRYMQPGCGRIDEDYGAVIFGSAVMLDLTLCSEGMWSDRVDGGGWNK